MIWRFPIIGRVLLGLSLLAFLSFDLIGAYHLPATWAVALKGAAVALLAVLALTEGEGRDGCLLAVFLALGAAGDVAIEFYFKTGAVFFLVGHLVATTMFCFNRREQMQVSQRALGIAVLVLVPLLAWAMTGDIETVFYAVGLSSMAASAWTSRFSRYSAGIGAMLFVCSDLLIFARMGPLAGSSLPKMLIWPFYYFGQYLICLGVLRGLQTFGNNTAPSKVR